MIARLKQEINTGKLTRLSNSLVRLYDRIIAVLKILRIYLLMEKDKYKKLLLKNGLEIYYDAK